MARVHEIDLEVNGESRVVSVEGRTTLADLLRGPLRLTGTHVGCEHGVCGACTVLLDGEPVRSCIMLAAQAEGHAVTTIEGLAEEDGSMNAVQEAFCEAHGMQCGFCTPGMVLATQALLDRIEQPTNGEIDEAIGGNICRCTGYVQIREAVGIAAERRRACPQQQAGAAS